MAKPKSKKASAADEAMLARLDALGPEGLLPCPFCGGEAERIDFDDEAAEEENDNFGGSCISCTKCGASSVVVFGRKETLFSSWNERAAPIGAQGDG